MWQFQPEHLRSFIFVVCPAKTLQTCPGIQGGFTSVGIRQLKEHEVVFSSQGMLIIIIVPYLVDLSLQPHTCMSTVACFKDADLHEWTSQQIHFFLQKLIDEDTELFSTHPLLAAWDKIWLYVKS